ncbi:MAG TPA: response regulator [Anaeromyxobacteraceae bacterium]|nr:response regulator [Anaeromyxobacteraceae bacterium]
MPKKVLLIESDATFARQLSGALESKGFQTQVAADGKEGLDAARDLRPDAIVLCVELPGMSGYSICNRLKKDEELKGIPLVITSAEATPETFEQHKKLRARAEDYLIKPFDGAALLSRLAPLLGAPEAPEEEVVTLADVELEALGALEPGAEILDEQSPPAPPRGAAQLPAEDEDLKLLDDAFDSIAAPPAPRQEERPAETPVQEEEIAAAAESLPEPGAAASPTEIDALGDEADAALDALSAGDEPVSGAAVLDEPPSPPAPRAASSDLLRAAGIPLLGEEPARRAPPPPPAPAFVAPPPREEARSGDGDEAGREPEALRRELEEARAATARAERQAREREGDLKLQKTKLDGMSATVKRLETDLRNAREETRRATEKGEGAEREVEELRARVEEAERTASEKEAAAAETAGRLAALERELEDLKNELLVARGEVEGARGQSEKHNADLRHRVQELEAATAKHEERVVKAYQKIKSDEKLREKTRKALTIALQLLDERAPVEPGEKERRPAPE